MLELVIVIAILAIVAAIAVPRLSRGSQGAAEAALKRDLNVLRNALELYRAEHGGGLPDNNMIDTALFAYSNGDGTVFSGTATTECYLGPYLRPPPPPLPVGRRKGAQALWYTTDDHIAWVYSKADGTIKPNTDGDETDASGTLYSDY
jgi:type II secretory pathway pseudopilin PulG